MQDSVLAAVATALLDSHMHQEKAANCHPYDVPVQTLLLLAHMRLMLVILFSLGSLLFLGTHHNLFSYSAMLTTEVDKIKHPKSHNPEIPGDFSCYLSSEWPPAPQNVPTSSYASHFFPPSQDILWDCPHRNLKLLMLPLSGFQTFNPFY